MFLAGVLSVAQPHFPHVQLCSRYLDFDLSEEAACYFGSGPPLLQRYLPFWVADFINRMKIMLVPLIVVFSRCLKSYCHETLHGKASDQASLIIAT